MLFSSRFPVPALIAVLSFPLCVGVRAVEIEGGESGPQTSGRVHDFGTRVAAPEVAPASNEGEQALGRMQLPAGLEASLWAAEPMLANPVAFNFDEQGRIFVAETYRYRTSVLDIRDYLWMVEDDLAARTIEDRAKLVEEKLGAEGVKELSIESELLRVLEDRDGDGKADHSAIYADGFSSVLDGIASGVLARRGDVWFTNIPSLWKFTGHEKAETREELSRGYGVRFNYTGHDFHGLIFGPDGKIYFSCGDRGTHVPTKEGGVISVPDTGAVFRCNPDGSELELVASGLRNPQSLLFTENGDLFTGDNDSDQGDEERLVHVVEGGDSGWRVGYQFAPLGNAGPWNSEKMWHLRHPDQAAFMLPPVAIIEDGPSGIAYYPGTGLDASYQGTMWITHFKGSIARSGIYSYKVKADGAGYAIADSKPFLTNALPTDVRFGPDGRLYYSDWAEGWPKSKKGRIYAISDPKHVNDPLVQETRAVIASDYTKKSNDELVKLIGHADWRVRLEAQFTLAERGAASIPFATAVLKNATAGYAGWHATWALGQIARQHPEAVASIQPLIKHADSEVRAQSAKLLGDLRVAGAYDALIAALGDSNARVRFFAAQSLGKLARPEAASHLFALLRENNDNDPSLRHAAVMGLVGANNLEALTTAARSTSRAERLGAVLALRRLDRPEIAAFLSDSDPLIVRETALAINDAPVQAALPELAAMLTQSIDDERVLVRAINANFRLGQTANARALAAYAANPAAPETMRSEALAQLALWPKPPARDRVVGIFRPIQNTSHEPEAARLAIAEVSNKLLSAGTPDAVQVAAMTAIENLKVEGAADALVAVVRDDSQAGTARAAALQALDKVKDSRLAELVTYAGSTDSPELRLAALPIAARLSPETAAPLLERLATVGNASEQRAAYRALGNSQHPSADKILAMQLEKLAKGNIPVSAQLELVEAGEKRPDARVKKLLADRAAALAAETDPLAPYRFALEGGDSRKGSRIFWSQPVMACVRCHTAGGGGGDAGPPLAMIGAKHDREYLLESIVKPNAKIAPGFDSIVVTLKSGAVAGGTVAKETATTISLRDADGKITEVKKADIKTREGAPSSMPEIYQMVMTKAELRDVVEFLANLTKPSDDPSGTDVPRALRNRGR